MAVQSNGATAGEKGHSRPSQHRDVVSIQDEIDAEDLRGQQTATGPIHTLDSEGRVNGNTTSSESTGKHLENESSPALVPPGAPRLQPTTVTSEAPSCQMTKADGVNGAKERSAETKPAAASETSSNTDPVAETQRAPHDEGQNTVADVVKHSDAAELPPTTPKGSETADLSTAADQHGPSEADSPGKGLFAVSLPRPSKSKMMRNVKRRVSLIFTSSPSKGVANIGHACHPAVAEETGPDGGDIVTLTPTPMKFDSVDSDQAARSSKPTGTLGRSGSIGVLRGHLLPGLKRPGISLRKASTADGDSNVEQPKKPGEVPPSTPTASASDVVFSPGSLMDKLVKKETLKNGHLPEKSKQTEGVGRSLATSPSADMVDTPSRQSVASHDEGNKHDEGNTHDASNRHDEAPSSNTPRSPWKTYAGKLKVRKSKSERQKEDCSQPDSGSEQKDRADTSDAKMPSSQTGLVRAKSILFGLVKSSERKKERSAAELEEGKKSPSKEALLSVKNDDEVSRDAVLTEDEHGVVDELSQPKAEEHADAVQGEAEVETLAPESVDVHEAPSATAEPVVDRKGKQRAFEGTA